MNNILKDRVRLIRAMISVSEILAPKIGGIFDNVIYEIRQDKNNHFLSISQDAPMQVSFARKAEDKTNNKRRVRTSLGRYLNKNFEISEHDIHLFVSQVWGKLLCNKIDVKIYSNKKIIKKYEEFGSTDAESCMTGEDSWKTDFYAINPDKVSLVCFEGIRALLWTTDQGVKVLDRCYPSGHSKIELLRQWALAKGYVVRSSADSMVSSEKDVSLSDGKAYSITMKYDLKYDSFPYLDTFQFARFVQIKAKNNRQMKRIVLSNAKAGKNIVLNDTEGGYHDVCHCCVICDYITTSDYFIEHDGKYYCRDCCSYCEICGKFITRGGTYESNNYEYLCKECFNVDSKKEYKDGCDCAFCLGEKTTVNSETSSVVASTAIGV